MKISVITATFNSEEYILSALRSIEQQSCTDIELVIIDGASTDNTISIVKGTHISQMKVVTEKDNGIYDALNKGVKLATGNIVGFVHSDDYFASNDILREIQEIFIDESVDGVYGDLVYINKNNFSRPVRQWKGKPFSSDLLKRGWMPAHPTLFLKKEVYDKHGLYNVDYQISADYDFILRIFQDPTLRFRYLPKVITKMRMGGVSNRSLGNIKQKSREDLKALKANGIPYPYFVLASKNLSKIRQFF